MIAALLLGYAVCAVAALYLLGRSDIGNSATALLGAMFLGPLIVALDLPWTIYSIGRLHGARHRLALAELSLSTREVERAMRGER